MWSLYFTCAWTLNLGKANSWGICLKHLWNWFVQRHGLLYATVVNPETCNWSSWTFVSGPTDIYMAQVGVLMTKIFTLHLVCKPFIYIYLAATVSNLFVFLFRLKLSHMMELLKVYLFSTWRGQKQFHLSKWLFCETQKFCKIKKFVFRCISQ